VSGSDTEADLDLAWGRLEIARGRPDKAAQWLTRAITIDERLFQAGATPANAWVLARTLEFTIEALPQSALEYRHRIADVWGDQDRRYPHHPWIEQRLAEAHRKARGA
jgi:hypothetical protein